MPEKVWVVGEALIDLFPKDGSHLPIVGGGAANTARALANLAVPNSFVGGISTDKYGEAIVRELSKVDLSLAHHTDLPTALAVLSLDDSGSANYDFRLEGTSTFDFNRKWLPKGEPEVLHIGTLSTVIEPGASELFAWASEIKQKVVFDPNVRPSVISDMHEYRKVVEPWIGISTIVKLSEEDFQLLRFVHPNELLEIGCDLVVLTRGANGISAFTDSISISTPGVKVDVVDTVGAGDTVGAVLVEGLVKYGFEGLLNNQLFATLSRAAKAASITCSRAGANPPSSVELD